MADNVEHTLRWDIILGTLPEGSRLRMADLSARYDISPTPIREALQRLASKGLVEIRAQKGARVRSVSQEEIVDVYEVRRLLESRALSVSIAKGSKDWLESVLASYDNLGRISHEINPHWQSDTLQIDLLERWIIAHRQFHFTMYSSCSSKWLMHMIGILMDHSEQHIVSSWWVRGSPDQWCAEHRPMIGAIKAMDETRAVDELNKHLLRTVELLSDLASPAGRLIDDGHS